MKGSITPKTIKAKTFSVTRPNLFFIPLKYNFIQRKPKLRFNLFYLVPMKVKFLKDHLGHTGGTVEDMTQYPGLANYLIRVGVAEEVKDTVTFVDEVEKVEQVPAKEKKENKTGNVPTAVPATKKKKQ